MASIATCQSGADLLRKKVFQYCIDIILRYTAFHYSEHLIYKIPALLKSLLNTCTDNCYCVKAENFNITVTNTECIINMCLSTDTCHCVWTYVCNTNIRFIQENSQYIPLYGI